MKKIFKFSIHAKYRTFSVSFAVVVVLLFGLLAGSAQTNKYLYTGSETNITLAAGTYTITAYGAQGGSISGGGGLGAEMEGVFTFSEPTTLTLLVGSGAIGGKYEAGGGGGSFVVNGSTPLVVAGGGGGGMSGVPGFAGCTGTSGGNGNGTGLGGTNGSGGSGDTYGNGGGGFSGNGGGVSGGFAFINGGGGGIGNIDGIGKGGYGGGGGGYWAIGGGGGYSGGGGGGGGGGSIIDSSAISILTEISGVASPDDSPNGEIIIASPAPPVLNITQQPQCTTNNLGDTVVLSVAISGGTPSDYRWYFSGTNIDNGTNSTLTIASISQPFFGNYFVVITNAFSSVTSAVATIYEPPCVISQPANVVVPFQSSASFNVSAVGYPAPTYFQWTLNGTNLNGANSSSLTIPSVKISNTGNYQVIVSNTISATNSSIATLNMSPSITSPFVGATPIWGRNTTLSVGAIGNGTLTYQWYFNGQAISGADFPQLDFSSIQLTNSGFYSVVISSPYGNVTNTAYQVAVQPSVVTLGFYPGLTINGSAGNSYLIQRSADLSNTNNWHTLSSLTMYQPVELWIDTSVDATSPFNNMFYYQLIPQ